MSKRKYRYDVSVVVYGYNKFNKELGSYANSIKSPGCPFPCRIVREKFYRKLIKIYEQWRES